MNEEMLQKTDTDYAPWTIVEAEHRDYAAAKIISIVADRLQYELDRRQQKAEWQHKCTGCAHADLHGVLYTIHLARTIVLPDKCI